MELSAKSFKMFRRIDNAKFFAYLSHVPLSTGNSVSSRRFLLVRKPSLVRIGDVVKSPAGKLMILMEHPEHTEGCEAFQIAHVSMGYVWKRPNRTIDPVAKVLRDNGEVPMGVIYTSLDSLSDLHLGGMNVQQYQFLTGQDVRVGDRVDGKIVKSVRSHLGVNFVELQ